MASLAHQFAGLRSPPLSSSPLSKPFSPKPKKATSFVPVLTASVISNAQTREREKLKHVSKTLMKGVKPPLCRAWGSISRTSMPHLISMTSNLKLGPWCVIKVGRCWQNNDLEFVDNLYDRDCMKTMIEKQIRNTGLMHGGAHRVCL